MCNQLKIRETQQIFADYVMLTRLYHTASDGKLGGGGLRAKLRSFHQLVFDDGGLYHHVYIGTCILHTE